MEPEELEGELGLVLIAVFVDILKQPCMGHTTAPSPGERRERMWKHFNILVTLEQSDNRGRRGCVYH